MTESMQEKGKKFVEQIEVAGDQLVNKIKELYAEGGNKVVHIKTNEGKELLTVPMSVGVTGGALVALAAPLLAAVGALAALVTKVRLEVEHLDGEPKSDASGEADAAPKDDAAN
ncbi:DUF4342 domain-containing protein [Kribbia dieselivorans]|uniref:DUF4342 domain-containing protein n=1 Tax=Kribbia dieselivorans TaxID=331526 RepID=UPI000838CE79|nr:DUF4342 domain-containing protein [Kribbia dieselivorans]